MTIDIKTNIRNWFDEENIQYLESVSDDSNFIIDFKFPDSGHNMRIVQPKGKSDSILIASLTKISQEHIKKMGSLSPKKKELFLTEFRMLLNSFNIEFNLDVSKIENILISFVVIDQIFSDGLTKDHFFSTIKKVFRTKLQAVYDIQKRFGSSQNQIDQFTSENVMYQ